MVAAPASRQGKTAVTAALARLHEVAGSSDLTPIEGGMGLFDGEPRAADLAVRLGIPVLSMTCASAMAGTLAALLPGLRDHRPDLPWAGVVTNRVAGEGHEISLTTAPRVPRAQNVSTGAFGRSEAIYGQGPVRASCLPAWFASSPEATAHLFLPEAA